MSTAKQPGPVETVLPPLIGDSPAIERARAMIDRFAATNIPVLIIGATGTGKELVARHVHAHSGRVGRFVPVNCGAMPRDIAESLLFGHRRGAFSGAVESRLGQVERAHGGTLFLDELLSLPTEVQPKLLRALDTGEIQPLGEAEERCVDVRVVASAQESLTARLAAGDLRYDLFQRIAGVLIRLPSLAARPQDTVPLAVYFARTQGRSLEPECARLLLAYPWPGSVRELRMAVERAGQLVRNGTITPAALAEAIEIGAPGRLDERAAARAELAGVCKANAYDARGIAAALGVARSTLFERLRVLGISLRELKKSGESADGPRTFRTLDGEGAPLTP